MKHVLLLCWAIVLAATAAEAKRYVGETAQAYQEPAPTTIARARWSRVSDPLGVGSILRGVYRCRGAAEQCPSLKRGKLYAELQRPGDFYGSLTFKDGRACRVIGSFGTDAIGPREATQITLQLNCGVDPEEPTHSFIGTVP